MEQGYLIDTNVVIGYFDQTLSQKGVSLMDDILPCISVISKIELLGWPKITPEELERISSFVNDSIVFSLTDPIVTKTISLRRSQKIKIPDAIIAATALTHNLTLLTRNTVDFKQIPDLKLINPFELQ